MANWLVIAHPDGRMYAVSLANFHAIYEPLGFVGVIYEDHTPYAGE